MDMPLLETALDISFVLVMLGVAFAFLRLVLGPTLPDRVVALDMMTVLIVAFCGLYAVLSEDTAFIDVAIVLALVGFLATVALARFVERRRVRSAPHPEVEVIPDHTDRPAKETPDA